MEMIILKIFLDEVYENEKGKNDFVTIIAVGVGMCSSPW
jgi:hypothetical protein